MLGAVLLLLQGRLAGRVALLGLQRCVLPWAQQGLRCCPSGPQPATRLATVRPITGNRLVRLQVGDKIVSAKIVAGEENLVLPK